MSSAPREALACLRAIGSTALRQRVALIRRDQEAMRVEDEALAELLAALRQCPAGEADPEIRRVARAVREQLEINAALAENGQVIAAHLVTGLAAARPGGDVGCQLSEIG